MTGPWIYRIDAVPRLGATVEFSPINGGPPRMGTVVPASRKEQAGFTGIGSEIVYQSNGRRYLGDEVGLWRYRDEERN